ncbi:transcriptional regulator [Candidatus Kaiserbacteria bacterium CG10_big_fil_rev_8_21_14_0_10_45_20]|uniref:Transcriptional regulator n=1 Tax=Candidatus Kaiserbacteria bacterium CG10_big_fil_rev_8_21_14_0_10_45_20 TaxID=1974607 RepID=A0A2H0UFX2_9BACT|nr:MAG: transcriptional regulator [Candidatus Kaiserbacteria bacterium CG10_big_fil_rev_8_21_14_0_10_45_20]
MKSYTQFKKKALANARVKKEYQALEPEFRLVRMLIKKRLTAGLSQSELAQKVGTKQSAISRLESGTYNPTVGMLRKVAHALGADIQVSLK